MAPTIGFDPPLPPDFRAELLALITGTEEPAPFRCKGWQWCCPCPHAKTRREVGFCPLEAEARAAEQEAA